MPYPSQAKRQIVLEGLRAICLALSETSERLSQGAPSFFVREKKRFLMLLVDADPAKFFVPPYVGHRDWLGVAGVIEDAFITVAPKSVTR